MICFNYYRKRDVINIIPTPVGCSDWYLSDRHERRHRCRDVPAYVWSPASLRRAANQTSCPVGVRSHFGFKPEDQHPRYALEILTRFRCRGCVQLHFRHGISWCRYEQRASSCYASTARHVPCQRSVQFIHGSSRSGTCSHGKGYFHAHSLPLAPIFAQSSRYWWSSCGDY
jgi:hypothetical protein